jgi:hypothetical protein
MPGKSRFDADAVRKLVRTRLETGTLRVIAEEIGISRGGLESFLNGREPYSKNRLALAAWQMRQRSPEGTVAREEVDAALVVIERYIELSATKAIRAKRVREVTERLAGAG